MAHEVEVTEKKDGHGEDEDEEGPLGKYGHLFGFPAQHSLLSTVQTIMEQSCFEFLTKFAPDFIAKMEWDCVERAEMAESANYMLGAFGVLSVRAGLDVKSGEWNELLKTCVRLRNQAVHRIPLETAVIRERLQAAVRLAVVLGDYTRADELETLLGTFNNRVSREQLKKQGLMWDFLEQYDDIERQRRELDTKEEEMRADMRNRQAQAKARASDRLRLDLEENYAGIGRVTTHTEAARRNEEAARRNEEAARRNEEVRQMKEQLCMGKDRRDLQMNEQEEDKSKEQPEGQMLEEQKEQELPQGQEQPESQMLEEQKEQEQPQEQELSKSKKKKQKKQKLAQIQAQLQSQDEPTDDRHVAVEDGSSLQDERQAAKEAEADDTETPPQAANGIAQS
ncbi:putative ubiquinol-cytochrome-c reductase cytochrome c1 [Diplodia seriata]|uniref:Putative ubiquinol-cytochrome-c reductase cytochrome c1 n=1 Tax=Diplodia seriata TaxID=420778 RepID=A0A0G2E8Y4_9PEZI|nr:putative ubiquinol-cytochrome-c reductase cytochrome c1 [Diplodia seriata]